MAIGKSTDLPKKIVTSVYSAVRKSTFGFGDEIVEYRSNEASLVLVPELVVGRSRMLRPDDHLRADVGLSASDVENLAAQLTHDVEPTSEKKIEQFCRKYSTVRLVGNK